MLRIRREQMQILARENLTATLLEHARRAAPEVCAQTSQEHLNAIVAYCIRRCGHYEISRDYDILRYLNLMLVFGVTFDRDQTWAAEPLAFSNPEARMELLMDQALRQIPDSGETGAHPEPESH